MNKILFLIFSVFIFFNLSALAEQVIILDTAGVIRSVTEVETSANIKFTINDSSGIPLEGAIVNLSLKDSDQKRRGISTGGVVEFENVTPGQWIVSTENPKLLFTHIEVNELGASGNALASNNPALGTIGDSSSGISGTASGLGTTSGAAIGGASTASLIGGGILVAGGVAGLAVAIEEAADDDDDNELSPST